MQFQIDGTNAGSPVTLSNGTATYETSTLAVGSHSVAAIYSGDSDFAGNISPIFSQTVIITSCVGTEILGDGQPGFWSSDSTTWATSSQGLDGGSLISSTANGSTQSMAAWWFWMPAGVYEIDMTWPAADNLTAKLGLDLYDGVGNWIGQIPVNEQVAPSDFIDQGVAWKRLGSVDLTNDIFHISTWNSPTDGAIASTRSVCGRHRPSTMGRPDRRRSRGPIRQLFHGGRLLGHLDARRVRGQPYQCQHGRQRREHGHVDHAGDAGHV